jgi:hypothetical protein
MKYEVDESGIRHRIALNGKRVLMVNPLLTARERFREWCGVEMSADGGVRFVVTSVTMGKEARGWGRWSMVATDGGGKAWGRRMMVAIQKSAEREVSE